MKKTLALLLALCMVLSLLPVSAMAAPAQKTAQIQANPEMAVQEAPETAIQALPQLPALPNAGDYSITATVVSGSSHGKVQLTADSADALEKVYLLANPDDGYLVEFGGSYEYRYYELEINYLGLDIYEIVMPDGDVDLEISFVKATGSNHSVKLSVNNSAGGSVSASRTQAKEGESVILTVTVNTGYTLDALYATYGDREAAIGGYLGQDENGQELFEVIMPGDDLIIEAVFTRNGPFNVKMWLDSEPEYGTAAADVTQAYHGETVYVTLTPASGCRLVSAVVWSVADDSTQKLTSAGGNRYSFVMPNGPVEVHVVFEPVINPVTVTVDANGIGGTAFADVTEAQQGDTVTLTCLPEEGYRVAQITGVSGLADNGGNTYSFTMPGTAVNIHVLFLRLDNPFVDVNETHFFYDPVLWAVENGITNGIDATHFGPFLATNRAAVVTMLWRYAGSPEPTTTDNPFEDVPEGSFYHKAVLWAVENGITNGMTPTTFGPDKSCNRAQVVTFLWRFLGEPTPGITEHPFTDVEAGSFYEQAVLWALENKVTTGATATTFAPNGECQRAQFVTFLYRAAQLPKAYALHWVINGFQDTPSDYGTVSLSHTSAVAGETITATVVPAEGYVIDWVKCEFGTAVTQVSDTEFTFVMPEHAETFHVNFVEAPVEPEPTEPDPTDPEVPAETYSLTLKDNGFGTVSYVDKMEAAAGESIYFYAVPNEGYYLEKVEIFNPTGEIDVSTILVYGYEDNLYEIIMIEHDLIMTCVFSPIPNT